MVKSIRSFYRFFFIDTKGILCFCVITDEGFNGFTEEHDESKNAEGSILCAASG